MSRSYKKHNFCKDGNHSSKPMKKTANHIVRQRLKDINYDFPRKSKLYRKIFNSWDINDYVTLCSEEDCRKEYEEQYKTSKWFRDKYPTFEIYYNWWAKIYKRK